MKGKWLLLGLIALLYSCREEEKLETKESEWYPCVVGNDHFYHTFGFGKSIFNDNTKADYRIYYIGKKTSVIQIDSFFEFTLDSIDYFRPILFEETGKSKDSRNNRYNKKNAAHTLTYDEEDRYICSPSAFRIRIDTTQLLEDHYPVFLTNQWDDTVIVCTGYYLPLWLEAKNKKGYWQPLQERHFYFCGTGLKTIILPPKELIVSLLRKPKGNFKTSLRLTTGFVHSNTIYGFIDEKWLEALPAYDR